MPLSAECCSQVLRLGQLRLLLWQHWHLLAVFWGHCLAMPRWKLCAPSSESQVQYTSAQSRSSYVPVLFHSITIQMCAYFLGRK